MLDLRKPIAYFFVINALILVGYGIAQPSTVRLGQEAVNLNLVWGGVMGLFAIVMLAWSLLEKK